MTRAPGAAPTSSRTYSYELADHVASAGGLGHGRVAGLAARWSLLIVAKSCAICHREGGKLTCARPRSRAGSCRGIVDACCAHVRNTGDLVKTAKANLVCRENLRDLAVPRSTNKSICSRRALSRCGSATARSPPRQHALGGGGVGGGGGGSSSDRPPPAPIH